MASIELCAREALGPGATARSFGSYGGAGAQAQAGELLLLPPLLCSLLFCWFFGIFTLENGQAAVVETPFVTLLWNIYLDRPVIFCFGLILFCCVSHVFFFSQARAGDLFAFVFSCVDQPGGVVLP